MSTVLALLFLALITAALAAAFVLAPRAEIVTSVRIAATPEKVWSVLADPAGHARWNPFLVRMQGEIRRGARLMNTMRPGGKKELTFRPVVLEAKPAKELRWLGRFLVPHVFDGEHYFILEERDGATVLTHGEAFRGVALWFVDVGRFRSDFEAMNAALKHEVEGAG